MASCWNEISTAYHDNCLHLTGTSCIQDLIIPLLFRSFLCSSRQYAAVVNFNPRKTMHMAIFKLIYWTGGIDSESVTGREWQFVTLRFLLQTMAWPSRAPAHALMPLPLLLLLLSTFRLVSAIKFNLPAYQYPPTKCIWNAAHTNNLVIVTANVGPGENQRVDVSILDSSESRNVYLSKRGIIGETRLAITTHADGEVGVCFKNHIEGGRYFSSSINVIQCLIICSCPLW